MNNYSFGSSSLARLNTCHNDLQLIAILALEWSQVDFGISHGHRDPDYQKILWQKGRDSNGLIVNPAEVVTYKDGKINKSKHNLYPSMALDVFAFVNGKASWDAKYLCYIAGVFFAAYNHLADKGKIAHKLRWGGNWDGNGEIITDQSFIDLPHFELI